MSHYLLMLLSVYSKKIFFLAYTILFLNFLTIFIDRIAPKWVHTLRHISSGDLRIIPMGVQHSIYAPSSLVIILLCNHSPRGLLRVPILPNPPPFSEANLHSAALLRMRAVIIFAHILACSHVP